MLFSRWRFFMPAQLVALDNSPSILLDKPILLLGRHPECDIQIDSRKISRRHCCIAQVSDYLVIRDLGSTNGIRINGVRLVEGRLSAGDELTIGNNRYKVAWETRPTAPVSPPPAPKRTARDAAPAAGLEDELLESCEEPIPLEEPSQQEMAHGLPIAPVAPNLEPRSPPPESPVGDLPLLLPDELELMPRSEHFHNKSPRPSESGVHPSA
jgi:predicted component of type VI protein secretion system